MKRGKRFVLMFTLYVLFCLVSVFSFIVFSCFGFFLLFSRVCPRGAVLCSCSYLGGVRVGVWLRFLILCWCLVLFSLVFLCLVSSDFSDVGCARVFSTSLCS